jgi:uncharacterized membrane protein YbhN (UPF0104 family)
MKKSPWLNFITALIKFTVFVFAGYFIFEVVQNNLTELKSIDINADLPLFFVGLISIITYMVLMMALVFAWLILLGFEQPKNSAAVYFKSQILKYLPGNVFHFAYRHQQTQLLGFKHKHLVLAAVYESISLVAASMLVANLLFLWPQQITWLTSWLPIPYWPILVIQIMAIIFAFKLIKGSGILSVVLCHLIYFFVMGWLAFILILSLGFESQPYLYITACFAASWLAGYVIPGAPGGAGVREAIFILLCTPKMAEYEALIIIAMIRLVSVFAETILYFIATRLSQFYRHFSTWSGKTMP